MTPVAALAEEVTRAIDEIRGAFPAASVSATPDGSGGAWVIIDPVALGSSWSPTSTWLGFHVLHTYPYSDVYPHFIGEDVRLSTTGGLPNDGITSGHRFHANGRPCLQVSRRSNRWDARVDTAANKALKVLSWLEPQ